MTGTIAAALEPRIWFRQKFEYFATQIAVVVEEIRRPRPLECSRRNLKLDDSCGCRRDLFKGRTERIVLNCFRKGLLAFVAEISPFLYRPIFGERRNLILLGFTKYIVLNFNFFLSF